MTKAPEINSPADLRGLSDAELAAWLRVQGVNGLNHFPAADWQAARSYTWLWHAMNEAARRLNQEDGA
jgi:hypothetical protein